MFALQPRSANVIPGLDGIRALCVMTIFVFHAQVAKHIPGELATTVFFFLSGFLITTLFVKEWRKTGDIALGAFYWRRALRTLPPLYVALGLAFIANLALHQPVTGLAVAGNIFNFTNYPMALNGTEAGFLPGMILLWSLAVDEHYYLLFAPAFRASLKRLSMRSIRIGLLVLCIAVFAWRTYLVVREGQTTFRETVMTDTRMDSILWGALLAVWCNPWLEPERGAWLSRPLPIVVSLGLLAFVDLSRNWLVIGTIGYTLQGIALIPIFALAIRKGGEGRLKFLHWKWLLWVARASYPLYLVQWLVILLCEQFAPGPHLVKMALALICTLSVGAAMHYGVERPLAKLRKRSRKEAPMPLPVEAPAPA